MSRLKMGVSVEKLRLANPFRISGHVFDGRNAVIVTLDDGAHVGRGEATGVYYIGDDLEQMLAALANARGAVLTRDQLIDAIHGEEGLSFDRAIDIHVSRLRRKLQDRGAEELIRTVRGAGYSLAVPVQRR